MNLFFYNTELALAERENHRTGLATTVVGYSSANKSDYYFRFILYL